MHSILIIELHTYELNCGSVAWPWQLSDPSYFQRPSSFTVIHTACQIIFSIAFTRIFGTASATLQLPARQPHSSSYSTR